MILTLVLGTAVATVGVEPRAVEFGVLVEPVMVLGSADGGFTTAAFVADFLLSWPSQGDFSLTLGAGFGLITARVRLSADFHWPYRDHNGFIVRAGGRYELFTPSDQPSGFAHSEANDYATGPVAELGVGYRWARPGKGVRWFVIPTLLVAVLHPDAGESGEDPVPPSGSAVFYGGTVGLGLTW